MTFRFYDKMNVLREIRKYFTTKRREIMTDIGLHIDKSWFTEPIGTRMTLMMIHVEHFVSLLINRIDLYICEG